MTTHILRKHTVSAVAVFLMFSFCGECLAGHREFIVRSDAEYPATPEKVVEEYVRKDAEGARLSGVKFSEIRDLFMWEEAGFDVAIIISGYNIETLGIEPDTAHISVSYYELGEFSSPDKWKPNRTKSTEIFILKKDGNRWRIAEPEIFPHVSLDTMIENLERDLEGDPRDESTFNILNRLKKVKEEEIEYAD